MTHLSTPLRGLLLSLPLLCALTACSTLPGAGPRAKEILEPDPEFPAAQALQIVEVNDSVVRQLLVQRQQHLFSETLVPAAPRGTQLVGPGDALEVTIWEAPPATLFGTGIADLRGVPSAARATVVPEQVVDEEGLITMPFAGRVRAGGQTLQSISTEIVRRLKGKANQPEVVVRLSRNTSSTVTIVGEVTNSLKMPLTPGGERVLDALAAAGGVRQPVSKMTLQVTRGNQFQSLPLDTVIRDPRQNVLLQAGDVITAMFQPLSFTTLGATGKNDEIAFEAQGINLAQALARSGGMIDTRSDPKGVFIFRFEPAAALNWPRQPVATTPEGLVPVVYRIDLKDPSSFFVMQSFPMNNKDVLYVANSPTAELQKFLNVLFLIYYPVINLANTARGF